MEHTLETEKMAALAMADLYNEWSWIMLEYSNWDMMDEYGAKMRAWLRIYDTLGEL